MFIARHGSWNRSKLNGYDVVRVSTGADGKSAKVDALHDGLHGPDDQQVLGPARPTCCMMPDGSLLVSDEQSGAIYRVSYAR